MSQTSDNQGLMMYWPFDEGIGANAVENLSQVRDDIQYVWNQAEFTESSNPQWRPGVMGNGCCSMVTPYIAHRFKEGDENRAAEYQSALSIEYGWLPVPMNGDLMVSCQLS